MKQKISGMTKVYLARLVGRILIFLTVLYIYFFDRSMLTNIVEYRFFSYFSPLHVIWIILMLGMIIHLLPKTIISMSGKKSREYTYTLPKYGYDRKELLEYVQAMNIRAWKVALLWISFNAIFGILYLCQVIGDAELILLTFFYFTCDLICMMIFCPFQKYIMGNRCCVNCRIFDWGHMMMYTPMVFIRSFFSWSLFFTALVIMISWEILYAKHPERFWRGSNATIRCENCKDKLCFIKKPLVTEIDRITSRMPQPVKTLAKNAEELDKH